MFQIGDRVVYTATKSSDNRNICQYITGTVVKMDELSIGVRWDVWVNGHSLDGFCESGYGWWVDESEIEAEDCEEISEFEPMDIAAIL